MNKKYENEDKNRIQSFDKFLNRNHQEDLPDIPFDDKSYEDQQDSTDIIPPGKPLTQSLTGADRGFISNHSGYDYEGSENYEHDDNGDCMNYSGIYDSVINDLSEHEGYQEGYDY